MIATENQYRITKDRLDQFTTALRAVEKTANRDDPLHQGHIEAIRSQIERLALELREYEALRSGAIRELTAETLADLPIALIKARVARGLSQSALAELIGVKPQQVQRWETEYYRKTNLERLAQIARALNVRVSERVELADEPPFSISDLRRGLRNVGFSREIIERRLISSRLPRKDEKALVDELDARLSLLLGMNARTLASSGAELSATQLRFKLPASAEQQRTRAYSRYVAGLCAIAAKCLTTYPRPLPTDWRQMRRFLFPAGQVTLSAAVETCWSSGIVVLPLSDPVAFHGACWRSGGRSVVALKQVSKDEARWLFDLIHELYHAATESVADDFVIIEADETSLERRDSRDERRAQRFAAEVLTDGRTEALTTRIAEIAGHRIERMKSVTRRVSGESGLPVGLLANLMAHRLAQNGTDWWGTAANLQPTTGEPWKLVRDLFLRRANLSSLSRLEFDVLIQCLETEHD